MGKSTFAKRNYLNFYEDGDVKKELQQMQNIYPEKIGWPKIMKKL